MADAPAPTMPPKVNPLKPGLKLPPKPTLGAGLKLPPKPGALGAGLKLPPKPAARPLQTVRPATAPAAARPIAPGVKAPTVGFKPVIRKPGALGAGLPGKLPVAPAAQATPAAAPAPTPAAAPAPTPAPAGTPKGTSSLDALKTVTQKLQSITQQIPQQAILHKTGIIAAEGVAAEPTAAQKQAAKSKTARISLSEAIGVAPVKTEPTPMKTIRIKRPDGLPAGGPAAAKPPAAAAPAAPTGAPTAAKPAGVTQPATSITQRKTLKISRPVAPGKPGAPKLAIKKPGTAATPTAAKPTVKPAAGGDVADIPEIEDIPDIAETPAKASAAKTVSDVPAAVLTVSVLVQVAACVVMGALGYLLYEACEKIWF